jgi:ribosome-associated protein
MGREQPRGTMPPLRQVGGGNVADISVARTGRLLAPPGPPATTVTDLMPTPHSRDHPARHRLGESGGPAHPRADGAEAAARSLAIEAARLLSDDKCEDVLVLDVRALSQVSDYLVIGSGTSDRQMRGTADDVVRLAEGTGHGIYGQSVDDRTTWVVIDCVDVVVHIFEPGTRAHYDLEMLWGEAPRLEWGRPEAKPPDRTRDRAGLGRRSPSGPARRAP